MILVSVVAFFIVRQNILASLDANLLQRATAAAQSELVDPERLAGTLTGALGAGDIRLALVYANGLAQSARGAVTAPPLGDQELAVARGEAESSVRTATDGRAQYRVVAVAAGEGRAGDRAAARRHAGSVDPARRRPADDRRSRCRAGRARRRGRRPRRPAPRAAADGGDRAGRRDRRAAPIPVDGSDELARLTASFNDMLGALAASQEQQRRLVADAGHELRTPLTSMRTNLELLTAASRPRAPPLPSPIARRSSTTCRPRSRSCRRWWAIWSSWRKDAPQVVHEPVELTDVVARALERPGVGLGTSSSPPPSCRGR